jgi:hypothetical protein
MRQAAQAFAESAVSTPASEDTAVIASNNNPEMKHAANHILTPPELDKVIRTHRCRLFRLAVSVLPGKDLVTEFWDSVEQPREPIGLPTSAELIEQFTGKSHSEVRAKLDTHRVQHGNYFRGDWSLRGSI